MILKIEHNNLSMQKAKGVRWTLEDELLLRDLWLNGVALDEIYQTLNRSVGSVATKLTKAGLILGTSDAAWLASENCATQRAELKKATEFYSEINSIKYVAKKEWDENEFLELAKLWLNGGGIGEICRKLERAAASLIYRLHQLGLIRSAYHGYKFATDDALARQAHAFHCARIDGDEAGKRILWDAVKRRASQMAVLLYRNAEPVLTSKYPRIDAQKFLDEIKLGNYAINNPSKLFKNYFYISHVRNLTSIVDVGILSLNSIELGGLRESQSIADPGAQRWREREEPVYAKSIHDYAPLYLNVKNPMMYVRRAIHEQLCVIVVSGEVVDERLYLFTDGNAASKNTLFSNSRSVVNKSIEVLTSNDWTMFQDGKRRRCAELLIYEKIPPAFICGCIFSNENTANAYGYLPVPMGISGDIFFNTHHE